MTVTIVVVAVAVVLAAYGLAYWAFRAQADRSAIVGLYLLIGFPALFVAAIGLAIGTVGGNPGAGALPLVTGLGFALPLLKPVRRLLAAVTPMDPDSPVDMVGLSLLLGLIAFFVVGGLAPQGDAPPTDIPAVGYFELIVQNLAFVGVAYAAVGAGFYRSWGKATERLGIVPPTPRVIGAAIGFTALAFLVLIVANAIATVLQPELTTQLDQVVDQITANLQNPLGAVVIGVAAGVGEEALFRGALQPRFGIGLVSVLFALFHAPQYGLNVAILGLLGVSILFGLARRRFGTTAAMITHALYNAIQVLLLSLL